MAVRRVLADGLAFADSRVLAAGRACVQAGTGGFTAGFVLAGGRAKRHFRECRAGRMPGRAPVLCYNVISFRLKVAFAVRVLTENNVKYSRKYYWVSYGSWYSLNNVRVLFIG